MEDEDKVKRTVPLTRLDDVALLEALWRERGSDLSVFDEEFLREVPPPELRATLERTIDELGAFEGVGRGNADRRHVLVTATHELPLELVRNAAGQIVHLLITDRIVRHATLEGALHALDAAGTATSWLLLKGEECVGGHRAAEPLAIASACKLWVLDAYRRAVAAGELRRDDVVTLGERHRAWPSGILQDAPPELPLTLESAAALMMGLSDNTATDVLIEALGRERVEAGSPFDPLLTNVELCKLQADAALESRYAGATTAEARRTILASLASVTLPRKAPFVAAPLPGAEWYASVEALCEVIERVEDEPSTRGRGGFVDRADWQQVTAKAGSETGVLNYTVRLVDENGVVWRFAVTWNGLLDEQGRLSGLDRQDLDSRFASVIARLRTAG